MKKIFGTRRADHISESTHNTSGHNRIYALGGDDTVFAGDGNDLVLGGDGDDRLHGEDGCDFLYGAKGNDLLWGGAHSDVLFGGKGNDTLDGGAGADYVSGGRGNDTGIFETSEGRGWDRYDGGSGCDTLVLKLTRAEFDQADFQEELAKYEALLSGNSEGRGHHKGWHVKWFNFESLNLKVRNWEKIEIEITDDPAPVDPVLSIADARADEGGALGFVVSLDKAAATDTTATYQVVLASPTGPGDADAGDLDPATVLSGIVTIPAGATSATISVDAVTDALVEGDETFAVQLSNVSAGVTAGDLNALGTIVDTTVAPVPQLSISDASVAEGGDLVFSVSTDLTDSADISVAWTVVFGSASAADLAGGTLLSGTAVIPAGASSVGIVLPTFDDALFEGDESLQVVLSNPSANAQIADATGDGIILDNDPAPVDPVLSIADARADEGGALGFVVSLDKAAATDTTATYQVVLASPTGPGDADAGDLDPATVLSGIVTIPAGATSATISVDAVTDALVEGDETFAVQLSNVSAGVTAGDLNALGTIVDTTVAPVPQLSISDASVAEGGDLVFSVSTDLTDSADISVAWTVVFGSASAADLAGGTLLSGTAVIPAGASSVGIVLPTFDDALFEGDESLQVVLSNPSANAQIADATGDGIILDNDPAPVDPVLSIADARADEGGALGFVVSLDKAAATDTTATYQVVLASPTGPGDADAGDLDPATVLSGIVTIPAGATSATISVDAVTDALVEGDETFAVQLSNVSAGVTAGDLNALGTIVDTTVAPVPQLSISDASVAEGGDLVFSVSTDLTDSADISVAWTVVFGSASAADLAGGTLLSGTAVIPAGASSVGIVLPTFDDALFEGDESLQVVLSNPSANAQIADATGDGIILDNDPAPVDPVLSIADARADEGGALGFVVSLDKAAATDTTATYQVVLASPTGPGDADAGDLDPATVLSGIVTIPAGATSATISVDAVTDALVEGDETFAVQLSNVSAGVTAGDLNALGTIVDTTVAPVPQLSISDASVAEGGDLVFSVSTDLTDSADISVAWTVVFGSASAADLAGGTLLSGTAVIPAGASSVGIVLPTFDDALFEGDESLQVVLSNPSANAQIADATGDGIILDNDPAPGGKICGLSWGDPHYVTFDGRAYDFQGVGEFILVESTAADGITVQTRTTAVGHNLSLNSAVATNVGTSRVTINTDDTNVLRIDGVVVASSGTYALDGGSLAVSGSTYTITYNNGEMLTVQDFGRFLNATYCANDDRTPGTLGGLLGNFDGDTANDLMTRDGATTFSASITFNDLYQVFGNSWRISQSESLFDHGAGEDTSTYTQSNFPWHRVTLDTLPQDKVAEAIQLLDALGVTDPIVRNAAIIDYASTCDTSFIDGVPIDVIPIDEVVLNDALTIWTNGGQVVIGADTARATFDVGSIGSPPGTDDWSALGPSNNWSDTGNWTDGTVPGTTDGAVFGLPGDNGRNVVDGNRSIASLSYTGEGSHLMDMNGSSILSISDSVDVFTSAATRRNTLIVQNGTAVVLYADEFRIGVNTIGSGSVSGNFVLETNASLDASAVSEISVGYATQSNAPGADAQGSLTLGANTSVTLGSAGNAAALTVGFAGRLLLVNSSTATGLLDASERAAVLDWNLSEVNIGWASSGGGAVGTLLWDQSEVLQADTIYFGRGAGQGILNIPTGGELNVSTGALRIAYNDTGLGTARADIDFGATATNATLVLADELSVGYATQSNAPGADAQGSLTLGANTSVTLGSAGNAAALTVGFAGRLLLVNSSTATGLLDASERAAVLDWNLSEVNIGWASSGGGAVGTLLWDQSEVLQADTIYFGRGAGQGILNIPTGGELNVSTGALRIAYNDTGLGTARADIDFGATATNATLVLADELSVGYATQSNAPGADAQGSLTLGANTSVTLGSAGNAAALTVGFAGRLLLVNSSTATGLLDASERAAVLDWNLSEVNIGWASSGGGAVGTLLWDQSEVLQADTIYFGRGAGQGILNIPTGGELNVSTGALRIAYNDTGLGTARADIDFGATATNATLVLADELSVGYATQSNAPGADAQGSLTLGANTSVTLGSAGNAAALTVGFAGRLLLVNSSTATGLLDASERAAVLDWNLSEVNIGWASSGGGAVGTLLWDQSEVLQADTIYFGRGAGQGILNIPTGGELNVSTGALRIAYNDTGLGTARADIDFGATATNATLVLADELSVGYATQSNAPGADAQGSLTLGANTSVTLGSAGNAAALTVGFAGRLLPANSSTATGLLDAAAGTFSAELSALSVGFTSAAAATGTLILGAGTTLSALTGTIGAVSPFGIGNGTLDFGDQRLDIGDTGAIHIETLTFASGLVTGNELVIDSTSGTFVFNGGALAVDTIIGDLEQLGGTLDIGRGGVAQTAISGNYAVASSGSVRVELNGTSAGSGYDVLAVTGTVNLNADAGVGAKLTAEIGYAASIGDTFIFIENDGVDAVTGLFDGLGQGGRLNAISGGATYVLEIDYFANDGNDIGLTVFDIL